MARALDNNDKVIDVRDMIDRMEELEAEREALSDSLTDAQGSENPALIEHAEDALATWDGENGEELAALGGYLADLKGYGGDHQWRGDWYPVTLIRDSHFKAYAQALAEDMGAINANATWPNNCIDWDQACRELQMDYTEFQIDGVTYWYR